MSKMNYDNLLDELCNDAFTNLVNLTYADMNYAVLEKKDIRVVDYKEWLVKEIMSTSDKGKTIVLETKSNWLAQIEKHLSCIVTEDNSRAMLYLQKARRIVEKIHKGLDTEDDIFDLFIIYISLMREGKPYTKKRIVVNDINCNLSIGDEETLKAIKLKEKYLVVKSLTGKKETFKKVEEKWYERRSVYITNCILLVLLRQQEGLYS